METMISETQVVIFDSSDKYRLGSIIPNRVARMAEKDALKTLPVHPHLLHNSGLSAYNYRSFGEGVELSSAVPSYHAPIGLMIEPGFMRLNYIIALAKIHDHSSEISEGTLRLVNAHGMRNTVKVTLAQQSSANIRCEWSKQKLVFVEGQSRIDALDSGLMNLSVYGSLPGAKILWVAVSQSA